MRTALALCLSLAAGPALAHEGEHGGMATLAALRHLLSQPDHLLGLAALVAVAAAAGLAWRRRAR